MEVIYSVVYEHKVVEEDIPRLSKDDRESVKRVVERKLTSAPLTFGKPLRHSLKGHRSIRVGIYRIVYRVEKNTVKIFGIIHRQISYTKISKRIEPY